VCLSGLFGESGDGDCGDNSCASDIQTKVKFQEKISMAVDFEGGDD
jgi:hypothetical protein